MPIIQNPNPVLRQKTEKVKKITPEIEEIILTMRRELKKTEVGLALAAPQLGFSKAIIVMGFKMKNKKTGKTKVVVPDAVLINPRIINFSKEETIEEEGCLSLMDKEEIRGDVPRADKIEVEFLNENGEKVRMTAEGFLARVLQHEIDHLNGTLFIDKADPSTIYQADDEKKGVNL